ncbi:MAG: EboA domain-containing protein [Verrucomicrobiae bacterium]|nr:EboA domain-containing protein [Verrucomicrobiae bacterium]
MVSPFLRDLLGRSAAAESMNWLDDEMAAMRADFNQRRFYFAFSGVSRRFDKHVSVATTEADRPELEKLCEGFSVTGWDEFRLARVILLTVLSEQPDSVYQETLEKVLGSADLREQVAIFSALPLLPEPGFLLGLAREGSRTNIVDVFDAIALGNPFPAAHFPEEAWNQLVLKSLFISRPLYRMQGIDERANATLAEALSNLAHERWAAGRYVSPELWRSCANFLTDTIVSDIERVATSDEPGQREAAALVTASDSENRLAHLRELLAKQLDAVRSGDLTWDSLGEMLATAS